MSDDKTKLDYSVVPNTTYYTRDSKNPWIQILTIAASNTHDEDVEIDGFEVKVPVSSKPKDPLALTSDPSSITPVSLQPTQWDFQGTGDGVFRASPIIGGTKIKAGESITFQLKNIIINQAEGTALIVITEKSGDEFPTASRPVVKIKSDLNIDKFNANPTDIPSGDPSVLSWSTTGAARVTLSPGDYPDIKVDDSVTVRPTTTTTYTLTAFGEGPNISSQVTVQIPPPKIDKFDATPTTVNAGDMVTLSWIVKNANNIYIVPGDYKNLGLEGSIQVKVQQDTTYTLYAKNLGQQSADATAEVKINPVNIKSFKADPSYALQLGNAVQLSWEIESATSAYIYPGGFNIPPENFKNGSWWVTPSGPTQYSLNAQNANGLQIKTINVFPVPPGWSLATNSAPFDTATIGVLEFNNLMWVFTQSGRTYNSWDGKSWEASGTQQWGRSQCSMCVFNNRMWLVGGKSAQGNYLNDVWSSSNGKEWTKVTDNAQWVGRVGLVAYAARGTGKLFVAGGLDAGGNYLNDVWSTTDGITWNMETSNAFPDGGRMGMALTTSENLLYILGGAVKTGSVNQTYTSIDGVHWGKLQTPAMTPRTYPKIATVSPNIYFGFGNNNSAALTDLNNLSGSGCVMNVLSMPVSNVSPYLLQYQGALWYLGGMQGDLLNKNVWSYNVPVNSDTSTFKLKVFDFDIGDMPGNIQFMIRCKNMPVNSKVGMYADKPGTNPIICLTNLTVNEPFNVFGMQAGVPPNYTCKIIIYAYAPSGTIFPENADISFMAAYPVNPDGATKVAVDGLPATEIIIGNITNVINK